MRQSMSRVTWDQLPDDVWARVLSCLLPPDLWVDNWFHMYRQWTVLSMQLICRKLRAVFVSNPSLCCNLALRKQYDKQQLKAVVHWVRQHTSAITHLSAQSCSQQCLETVLTMMQEDQKLVAVFAHMPSPYAISLLANIRTLTRCTFVREFDAMDMEPLASLPSLSTLCLDHANIQGVETLPHLTALRLNCSHIACNHSLLCITALLDLDVTNSTITQFHEHGVLACTRLESLVCVYGRIEAADAALHLRTSEVHSLVIPADLASLAALTSLVLTGSSKHQTISLNSASKLVSLQSLIVNLPCVSVCLSECIATLTNLTCLSIGAQRVSRQPVPCIVLLDIEWTAFCMLKSVCFTGAVRCDKSLCSLAALHRLESLMVYDVWYEQSGEIKVDEGPAREAWVEFAHWLGVHRPSLEFHYGLEEATESDYGSDSDYNSDSPGSASD